MEHIADPVFMTVAAIDAARQTAISTCERIEVAARQQRDYFLSLLPQHSNDTLVSEHTIPRDDEKMLRAAHIKAIDLGSAVRLAATKQMEDTLKLLPYYSDYGNALPKKETSRLSVALLESDWKEEGTMWNLYSEGLTAKPLNKFCLRDVLKWIKKQSNIDWGVLVSPDDLRVLQKYGFDKEGLRRARNRLFTTIAANKNWDFVETLDVIASQLPPAIAAQINFESLEKRFLGRWLLRMKRAKEEELYKTSTPHKRRLEELETEVQQLKEKRPRLFV